MSFVDELRTPTQNRPHEREDSIIKNSERAIRYSCLDAKNAKHNRVKGEIYFDDSDYGTYCITEKRSVQTEFDAKHNIDFDYVKQKLEELIVSLGFTEYEVKILTRVVKDKYELNFFGGPKRKTVHVIYVDLKW